MPAWLGKETGSVGVNAPPKGSTEIYISWTLMRKTEAFKPHRNNMKARFGFPLIPFPLLITGRTDPKRTEHPGLELVPTD